MCLYFLTCMNRNVSLHCTQSSVLYIHTYTHTYTHSKASCVFTFLHRTAFQLRTMSSRLFLQRPPTLKRPSHSIPSVTSFTQIFADEPAPVSTPCLTLVVDCVISAFDFGFQAVEVAATIGFVVFFGRRLCFCLCLCAFFGCT